MQGTSLPSWLERVCLCPVCSRPLVVSEQFVTCFYPGHVKLIGRVEFARRVHEARAAARAEMRVNLSLGTALRKARDFLRREMAPAAIPPQEPATGGEPAMDRTLFDLLTT